MAQVPWTQTQLLSEESAVGAIARELGVEPSHVLLRWALQARRPPSALVCALRVPISPRWARGAHTNSSHDIFTPGALTARGSFSS